MSKLDAGGPGLGFGGQRAGQGENGRPHTPTSLVCPPPPPPETQTHSSLRARGLGSRPHAWHARRHVCALPRGPSHHVCATHGCRSPAVLPLPGDMVTVAIQTPEGRKHQGVGEVSPGWSPVLAAPLAVPASAIHPH